MHNVLVIGVRAYSFVDEKDGRVIEGCTVSYVDPFMADDSGDRSGLAVMNATGSTSLYRAFSSPSSTPQGEGASIPSAPSPAPSSLPTAAPGRVPGVFQLQWAMRPGKGGRPVSVLVGAEFVKPVDIAKITESQGKKS